MHEETDLIKLAERDVLEKAKAWHEKVGRLEGVSVTLPESADLLAAVTLLESREALPVCASAVVAADLGAKTAS